MSCLKVHILRCCIVPLLWGTHYAMAMPPALEGCLPAKPFVSAVAPVHRVTINNVEALEEALARLQPGTELALAPGTYQLRTTLYIRQDNVTIRGALPDCQSTVLVGAGMEVADYGAVPHGIWTDAAHLQVAHLTMKAFFHHPIQFAPEAYAPVVYQCKLLDAGEQFIKSSAADYGKGVDGGQVLFTMMGYTQAPPSTDHGGGGSGYTNGVDVHGGRDWVVSDNLFVNFHVPDFADNLWNPAVLFWNGAQGTITRNNRFVDVDRAIAYGLTDRDGQTGDSAKAWDHQGGIIVNNMISLRPELFSVMRKIRSDASILVWDSPGTLVAHNTILNRGNHRFAVEGRFDVAGVRIFNNLSDASYGIRGLGAAASRPYFEHNFSRAQSRDFEHPDLADLRLTAYAPAESLQAPALSQVAEDFLGEPRPGPTVTVGAHEPAFRP